MNFCCIPRLLILQLFAKTYMEQSHNTDWFDLPAFCLLIKHCEYHFVCRPWTQFVFSSPVKILSLSALLLNNTSSVFATFYSMSNLGLIRKTSKSFNIPPPPKISLTVSLVQNESSSIGVVWYSLNWSWSSVIFSEGTRSKHLFICFVTEIKLRHLNTMLRESYHLTVWKCSVRYIVCNAIM